MGYSSSSALAFAAAIVVVLLPSSRGEAMALGSSRFSAADAFADHDILQAIKIPFDDPKTQSFEAGFEGFPAFGLKPGSDVKSPYRLFLPEKLYGEFSIYATIRTNSRESAFLFSVVNPLETVVQLGVQISPAGPHQPNNMNISLLYTDVNSHFASQTVASFTVPSFVKKWTRFAFKVTGDYITLFFNCQEFDTVVVKRTPQELVFDSASTLYVGQAGQLIKGAFDGALQELKLFGSASFAQVQCENVFKEFGSGEEPIYSDMESGFGSGDEAFYVDPDNPDQEDREDGSASSGEGSGREGLPPFPPPPPGPDDYGAKGPKGDRGERGPRGPPGESIRGPPGPPGPPGTVAYGEITSGSGDGIFGGGVVGPPGPPGVCACNLTAYLSTLQLPDAIQGPPGIPGIDGNIGPPGTSGLPGPPGERGAPGPHGEKGDRGDSGTPGPEGIQGSKGEPGRDGTPGRDGNQGPPGPPGKSEFSNYDESSIMGSGFGSSLGRPGSPGPKGEPGVEGTSGQKGDRGIAGSKGERGDNGLKGPHGDRGHQGPQGAQGFKGEPGAPGIDGLPGIPGNNGRDGSKGQKGESGEVGRTGPPGPPGIGMAIGLGNDGESRAPGLKGDMGPRGEDGELGPKGEKGDRGDAGLPGIPGTNGLQGSAGEKGEPGQPGTEGPYGPPGPKGDRGERGPPGPATIAGMDGEFITIKGEKGEHGKRGRRGKDGPQGPPGPAGKSGGAGEMGMPGWMGSPGRPGAPGLPGIKGEKGDLTELPIELLPRGPKGDRGAPGEGLRGPPGPPGPSGDGSGIGRYIPGPPGPPGPPGSPGVSIIGPKGEPGQAVGRGHVYGDPSLTAPPSGYRQGSIGPPGPPGPPGRGQNNFDNTPTKIVPGAVTFKNSEDMQKMSSVSPVGTLAYVIDEEALLVRVNNGWQYIALGSLLPITTQPPSTTTPQPIRPPIEASNLIGKPLSVDGPSLRIAALNEPYTGDLHGVRGADYSCYRQARRAGLRGTFRAFLSSRVQNLDSIVRFSDRELPVVNTKGDVLFNSWQELFNGNGGFFSQQPRIYSFSGKNIMTDFGWPQKVVWHGSHLMGERAMDTYCDAWHSSSTDKVGLASSLLKNKLIDQERFSCNSRFAVLCIEATSQIARRRRRRGTEDREDALLAEDDYQELLSNIMDGK